MKLISYEKNSNFRYVWLKTVEDVDLSQHCAKSLIGKYHKGINSKVTYAENLELEDKVYYLCGVAIPYNWENNFHLAFRPAKGKTLAYSNNGISVVIEDAEALPISTKFIDPKDPHYQTKSFYTCRNWQFAHYFNLFLKNTEEEKDE